MTDKNKPTTTTPALPSIDEIASVAPADLPEPTRATLDDAQRKLAEAIITATANGNAAVGPSIGDRKATTAAAARIKRLVNAFLASQGTPEAKRPTVTTRIVPKGDGYAWAVSLVAPTADEASDTDADAETAPTS